MTVYACPDCGGVLEPWLREVGDFATGHACTECQIIFGESETMRWLDMECAICDRNWFALYPLELSPEAKGLECPGCGYMNKIQPATSAIDECDCGHLRAAHGPDIRNPYTTTGPCRVPTCPCIDFLRRSPGQSPGQVENPTEDGK